MTAQVLPFKRPSKLPKLVFSSSKTLCPFCKTNKSSNIQRGKLCFGEKRFFLFGKRICKSITCHFHCTCSNCGGTWEED